MKVVACVPIKLENERLPGKNIKLFDNGMPLISYIQTTLLKIKHIKDIFVFCSDEKIKEYLLHGVQYKKRDSVLNSNSTNATEIIKSFVDQIDADIYVYTHATAPFLKAETVNQCIEKIVNEGYDSAFTVTKLQDFVWSDGKPLNYDPSNIPRTQDLKPFYVETSGLYVFKKNVFTELGRRIGTNPYLFEVTQEEAVDINHPADFEFANLLLSRPGGVVC